MLNRRLLGTSFLFLLAAVCCGGHAYLRPASIPENNIESWIARNYGTFEASFSGSADKPGAIRFDLKGDGITLTGEGWYPIGSESELEELAERMIQVYLHKYRGTVGAVGPQLYRIVTPDGRLIGFFYSPISDTLISQSDHSYRVAPVTELDVRNQAYPWYLKPPFRSDRGVWGR